MARVFMLNSKSLGGRRASCSLVIISLKAQKALPSNNNANAMMRRLAVQMLGEKNRKQKGAKQETIENTS